MEDNTLRTPPEIILPDVSTPEDEVDAPRIRRPPVLPIRDEDILSDEEMPFVPFRKGPTLKITITHRGRPEVLPIRDDMILYDHPDDIDDSEPGSELS